MSNSQLNKLKSAIKNGTEITLNLWLNLTGTSFQDKLLLTDTQVSKICKAFANGSSANIKFSKTQSSKIVQLGRFIYKALDPFLNPDKMIEKNIKKADELSINKCP